MFDLVLISFASRLKVTERASRSKVSAARHSSRCTKSNTNVLDMDDINGVNVLTLTYNTSFHHIRMSSQELFPYLVEFPEIK